MNRRVLLIDLDPIFRDQLIHLLGRYRVVVMHEPEVDRALALAAADAPSAIIIGVDEPDKAGFRVFQKCKKGALAKIPVVLVTSSVAPEAFAKHRGLKLHADEYLDKRTLTNDELLAKLDNLIGLGDLQEDDDIGIPIEDDIPMEIGDGDVVLDETVDAGGAELPTGDAPSEGHRLDSVVEAETDAAFDALLGGDASAELGHVGQPRAASEPAIVHAGPPGEPAADAIPEPVPHLGRDDRETMPPPFDEAVPEPVPDPGHAEAEPESAPALYEHSVDSDVLEEEPMSVGEEHDSTVHSLESSAAIPLDDQELVAVDEHSAPAFGGAARPGSAGPIDEPVAPARASLPRAASEPIITSATRIPSDPGVPVGQQTGNHPAIDLGLEAVASDADREQSGIHDRRALRKIAELDRQILQLKNELERARATAETAAKGGGREAQFLNLREQVLAKDRELTAAKADVGARDSELVEVREKLRQLQHAKQALEGKNSELEQRIFEGGDRSKELDGKLREALAQASRLQQELDTQQHAFADSETGRKRLEQELVDERARRAASASEAERALRAEREQLVERHRGDLATARDEGVKARDAALARLREQLDAAHAQSVEDAVEELRRANAEEHDAALATLERQHTRELVNLKADQAGELRRIEGELRAEITRLGSALSETRAARDAAVAQAAVDKAAALEELAQKHAATLDAFEEQHDEDAERNAEAQAAAIAQMKAEVDRTHAMTEAKLASAARDRDTLAADHEQRVTRLGHEHRDALAELQAQHANELERLADERGQLADSAKRAADAQRGALAELQQRLEAELAEAREHSAREASEQRATLQSMKRAADEASARHQKELDTAIDAHARVLAEAEAKHERALAMANGEVLKVRAATEAEHANTLTARDAEHEAARRELESEHARVSRDLTSERDELRRGLSSTRDQLRRSEAELASAVQAIAERNGDVRQHQSAIGERDQRIAELRKEIEALEQENASYQDQVLRAYQKIKSDEAMVARARKAMAIALTVLDDEGNPPSSSREPAALMGLARPTPLPLPLLLAIVAISTGAPFARWAEPAPSLAIAGLRVLVAAILLAIASGRELRALRALGAGDRRLVGLAGALLAVHFAAWIGSLALTSTAASVSIVCTSPMFAALLGVVVGDHVTRRELVGIAIGALGCAVLAGGDWRAGGTALAGDALAAVGAASAAGYLVVGRKLRAAMPLLPYLTAVNTIAALGLVAAAVATGASLFALPGHCYVACACGGAFASFVGHSMLNAAVRTTPTHLVALAVLAEPFGSSLITWIAFGEQPPVHAVIGGGVVVVGIAIGFARGRSDSSRPSDG